MSFMLHLGELLKLLYVQDEGKILEWPLMKLATLNNTAIMLPS